MLIHFFQADKGKKKGREKGKEEKEKKEGGKGGGKRDRDGQELEMDRRWGFPRLFAFQQTDLGM